MTVEDNTLSVLEVSHMSTFRLSLQVLDFDERLLGVAPECSFTTVYRPDQT